MRCEPDSSFVTSVVELKLDSDTMFEWQKHSHKMEEVPHYRDILEFIDLRAQASETSVTTSTKKKFPVIGKAVASFAANSESNNSHCTSERHPLYVCPKFKSMSRDDKFSTLKKNNLCMNCLNSGHHVKHCKSSHKM